MSSGPRIGELFAGYGGLGMGVQAVFGGDVAWYSEIDKGALKILEHRFPGVPNVGDVTTADWSQVEPVDILTGGFPCTDLSKIGGRAGLRPGTRSGLWQHMTYVINQLRPAVVVAENVRGLLSGETSSNVEPCPLCMGDPRSCAMRALGVVLADLAELGYDARWHSIRACDVGAPHERERVFLVATPADTDSISTRLRPREVGSDQGEERRAREADHGDARRRASLSAVGSTNPCLDGWREYAGVVADWERIVGRPAPAVNAPLGVIEEWMMGLPAGWVTDVPGITRNEALKACGNGVVPQQAAEALRTMLAWQVAA